MNVVVAGEFFFLSMFSRRKQNDDFWSLFAEPLGSLICG